MKYLAALSMVSVLIFGGSTAASANDTEPHPHCIKEEVTDRWRRCVNRSNQVVRSLKAAQAAADRVCGSGAGYFSVVYASIKGARKTTANVGIFAYTSTDGKRVLVGDSKSHQKMRDQIQKVEDKILKQCEALILKEAPAVPKETYKGPGKKKHRKNLIAHWKKAHPNDEVIAVIMDSNSWKRRKSRMWNATVKQWQYNDVSSLSASVIVKKTAKLAIIYPAYVNKNALKGGKISYGVYTKSGEFRSRFIPLDKL